jgi:alkylation response protein AidB-like acyl-CoA dehydrogenase
VTTLDALSSVVEEVIAPAAAEVDRTGAFPRRQIRALQEAGILGLTVPEAQGGDGGGIPEAAGVVREIGAACSSTAMIVTMHYSATAALVATERSSVLSEIAAGRHLSTLAFSEFGSRSHFWAPVSTATQEGGDVRLDARKSWVTSAGEADSYVWSSKPLTAQGPMTLWYVPADAPGLEVAAPFDGLGLRGNASSPVTGSGVSVPESAMLGADGGGLDLALAAVLPYFLVLNASASVGLMQAMTLETAAHLQQTRLEHLGQTLAQQQTPRAQLAQLQIATDRTRALVDDTLVALSQGRPDAQLLVLEVKAAAAEAAAEAADLALKAGGGSAYRKESGIERRFRDSRASRVMAPTTEALHDFIGRALCGLALFDSVDSDGDGAN